MIASPCFSSGRTVAALLGALLFCAVPAEAQDQEAAPAEGIFETVQNPITDATLTQIRNRIDRAINQSGGKVKKVVFDFNPDDSDAATPNYGSCRDFAEYIQKLKDNGIYTIAFVHGKASRHTVLPILACNDLVMSSDAKIGEAADPNERVPADVMTYYARVAGKSKEAVVLKMLDKNIQIVSGRKEGNTVYVDENNVEKEDVVITDRKKPPVLPRGSLGLYNLRDAMQFGLCTSTKETRADVATAYNISFDALHGDRDGGNKVKAVKITLVGPIDESFLQKLKGQLREVRSRNENRIYFVIECSGGKATVARQCADEIMGLKNDEGDRVWTVAFIPSKANDLAAFIAFACSEIVMYRGSGGAGEATVGDFDPFLRLGNRGADGNNVQFIRENLGQIAEQQGYPRLIVDALVDPEAEIVRARDLSKPGQGEQLMTRRELNNLRQRKGNPAIQERAFKQPGALVTLTATQAKDLRVVQTLVDNKDTKDLYTLHGITEKDVRDSKPGWLDDFAAFLRRTEIIFLLLAVAFAALILEFKMPGATVPGLISLSCFVLFFWSQAYAHGATIYLAVGLFVLGLLMLGIEIFVLPGFGVMGIGGVLLVLASVGLATMEKAPSSADEWVTFGSRMVQYGSSLFVAGVMAMLLARFLPKIPYANRLMLVPPTEQADAESDLPPLPGAEQAAALLGQVGTAASMLRPAGSARFGDVYVDVITEGDFIEPGTSIQVVEVEGTRIVVKKV